MDAQELIGTPLLVDAVAGVTVAFALTVAWIAYPIRRVAPELLQLQLFRKIEALHVSVLAMAVGLVGGMVLMTLFLANLSLPDYAWMAGAVVSSGLFWYGLFGYSNVFRVPRVKHDGR